MGLSVPPTHPPTLLTSLLRRACGRASALVVLLVVAVLTVSATHPGGAAAADLAPAASTSNPPTPGSFTGYGFDQCLAPSQRSMDAWWDYSPYAAVGIYMAGASRGCPSQPNLTPTWVRTQLARGWRLLPITLGPQASCTTRERYRHQVRINPSTSKGYAAAKSQGYAEAKEDRRDRRSAGDRAGQHALLRPRGVQHRQPPPAGSRPSRS